MAVSINQLFSEFNLNYSKAIKWNEKFEAKFNGVYIIAQTSDPFTIIAKNPKFGICPDAFSSWTKEATELKINGKESDGINEFTNHLNEFWNPNENILYIGQSSSKTNPIQKRVGQFYSHKLGQKGPHTGGYWMKLLDCLKDTYIFYSETQNPRDTEFKLLMKFIEYSSGKSFYDLENIGNYLPFANLTADFYKVHGIKNPTNKNRRKNAR
ncbi:hypothetical protein [Confluentibacter citreus]|uniref:hypothetical protein n=1 Tax=Confluentibacter citreus TaxID=2007307 RepID=UPI000C29211B|nr:hypothetical protein [Confluentibacter citreus]